MRSSRYRTRPPLDGSPVAQTIIKFMEDEDEYTGTSSALHKKLEAVAEDLGLNRDKAWPKSARWLWRHIKEVLPLLLAAGIETDRVEDTTGSKIILRKVPKNDATNATQDENCEGKPKDSGIKEEDNATSDATAGGSNDTGGNSASSNATPNPTGNADTYAGSGGSGISGNRNGGSWQSDPMKHYRRGGGE